MFRKKKEKHVLRKAVVSGLALVGLGAVATKLGHRKHA